MTTSEPTAEAPTPVSWSLVLSPQLVHNAKEVTNAVDALFRLMAEHEDKYVVTLEFDSMDHQKLGAELLGLVSSAGVACIDCEVRELKGFERQIVRLLKLVRERLRWEEANGNRKNKVSLAKLKRALENPLRSLLLRTRKLGKSILNLRTESQPEGALPDFQSVCLVRKLRREQFNALKMEWKHLKPRIPRAKSDRTPDPAWGKAFCKLFRLSESNRWGFGGAASQQTGFAAALNCFSFHFPDEASGLNHQTSPFTFLGGPVLGLCRDISQSNTGLEALTRTHRWRELLVIVHQLHSEAGCVRFRFASRGGAGADDNHNDDGQGLVEQALKSLALLIDQALEDRAEQSNGLIRFSGEGHDVPPASDLNERKILDALRHDMNSPAPVNEGELSSATQTVARSEIGGAVQTSRRPPPGLATSDRLVEKSDVTAREVFSNQNTPTVEPTSKGVSTTPSGSDNTPGGGGVALATAAAAVPLGEGFPSVSASGSKMTNPKDPQAGGGSSSQEMPAIPSSQLSDTCPPIAAGAVEPAKKHSVDTPEVIKIRITKNEKGRLQVLHVIGADEVDMSGKPTVFDSMLAFLVFRKRSPDGVGENPASLKLSYQEYFDLCFPPLTVQRNHDNFKRVIRQRIAGLKKYLKGIVIEDNGQTEFIVRNLNLVHTAHIDIKDVETVLKARAKR